MPRPTDLHAFRQALRLDAAASGAMGLLLLVAAGPAQPLLGLPIALMRVVGAGLLPFAVFLLWLASRPAPSRALGMSVVAGNVAWVVASLALLGSSAVSLTRLGALFVALQATAVAIFALLEHRGLREARRGGDSAPATLGA